MRETIVAVVPAYNEESLIGGVLQALTTSQRQGLLDGVIVVDDGSKDRTAEIAAGHKATVLRLDKNSGKAEAFRRGAEEAVSMGADIVFMTDADMLNLDSDRVGRFLAAIRGRPDVTMVRAPYLQVEGGKAMECPPEVSGFRAVRSDALAPLIGGNAKWMQYLSGGGFTLEPALELLIPAGKPIASLEFPLRSGSDIGPLVKGMAATGDRHLADMLSQAGIRAKEFGVYSILSRGKAIGELSIKRHDRFLVDIRPSSRAYRYQLKPGVMKVYGFNVVDDLMLCSRNRGKGSVSTDGIMKDQMSAEDKSEWRLFASQRLKCIRKSDASSVDEAILLADARRQRLPDYEVARIAQLLNEGNGKRKVQRLR